MVIWRALLPAAAVVTDTKKGEPRQWHFRNSLPADGLSLSSEIGRVGRPVAVRQNAVYLLAVVFFLRRRRPRSSLPFPALRRLAAVTAQRLLMSIAGSSSGDACKIARSSWICTRSPQSVGGPWAAAIGGEELKRNKFDDAVGPRPR